MHAELFFWISITYLLIVLLNVNIESIVVYFPLGNLVCRPFYQTAGGLVTLFWGNLWNHWVVREAFENFWTFLKFQLTFNAISVQIHQSQFRRLFGRKNFLFFIALRRIMIEMDMIELVRWYIRLILMSLDKAKETLSRVFSFHWWISEIRLYFC